VSIKRGGADVTKNYQITYDYGALAVSKRAVIAKTGSYTWTYDDQDHTHTVVKRVENIVSGHVAVYDEEGIEPTKVHDVTLEDVPNVFEVIIKKGEK
jgi:hypothetical protein